MTHLLRMRDWRGWRSANSAARSRWVARRVSELAHVIGAVRYLCARGRGGQCHSLPSSAAMAVFTTS
jgi:hypothetical protein